MWEKNTGICVPNSVEMHLLHDCEHLLSMQRKLVSDVIDGTQTNLSWENSLFGKLSEKFDDSASTLRSPSPRFISRFPVCCYIQFAWEVFCCDCDPPLQKIFLNFCGQLYHFQISSTPIFIKIY